MNHFDNNTKRVSGAVGASLDKVPAWTSAGLLSKNRVTKVSRKTSSSLEQAELWADPQAVRSPEMVAVDAAPLAVVEETVPYIEVKQLRRVTPVSAKSSGRTPVSRSAMSVPMPVRERTAPVISIARFLNVNGAVEGMKPTGMRFDLPGRGLSRTLRLWQGTTETATYSSTPL